MPKILLDLEDGGPLIPCRDGRQADLLASLWTAFMTPAEPVNRPTPLAARHEQASKPHLTEGHGIPDINAIGRRQMRHQRARGQEEQPVR